MKDKNRIIQWIDVVLNELSMIDDTKRIDILHACGGECSKLSPLLEGAEKIQNKYKEEQKLPVYAALRI